MDLRVLSQSVGFGLLGLGCHFREPIPVASPIPAPFTVPSRIESNTPSKSTTAPKRFRAPRSQIPVSKELSACLAKGSEALKPQPDLQIQGPAIDLARSQWISQGFQSYGDSPPTDWLIQRVLGRLEGLDLNQTSKEVLVGIAKHFQEQAGRALVEWKFFPQRAESNLLFFTLHPDTPLPFTRLHRIEDDVPQHLPFFTWDAGVHATLFQFEIPRFPSFLSWFKRLPTGILQFSPVAVELQSTPSQLVCLPANDASLVSPATP